ncbi:MAG: glycosyltransferase family 39 protein [Tolypothrix sp. Co-bin9]|nr:glycosyltransferase family 39 protein [Tolypothrix sp. Co-bin9]
MDILLPPKGLRFLILIILILGIFFRFTNLDLKLFEGDESITSVRAAGYTTGQIINSIPRDTIITPKEIEKFRIVSRETSLFDTLKVTALGAPQHTPLYFVLTRIWMQWFGNSAVAMRSFTVLTSLLVFPAIYWLCMELFKSSTVGSMAVALVAVSPVHIIHAQIARPRTLWILMILLSSAALIRTIRLNNKPSWVIYGLTLSINLYTFLFSIFVAIAHGIYVFLREIFFKTKILKSYLFTASLVILSFAPWLTVILTHLNTAKKMTDWTNQAAAFPDLLGGWLKNLCDIFFYWHLKYERTLLISEESFVIYFGIAILSLIIYAFYFLWKNTPRQVWLFIFTLTGVTALAVVLPDLIFGGRRSALDRYMFPCTLGIQITVAYLLATKISLTSSTLGVKSWRIVTVILISLGILSCTISGQTESWNGQEDFIIQSSRIINKATHPLIIFDDDIVSGLMPLNYRLDPHVRLMLVTQPNKVAIPDGFSDIFLFSPSQELLSFMQEKREWLLKPIYKNSYLNIFLWKALSPMILWKL